MISDSKDTDFSGILSNGPLPDPASVRIPRDIWDLLQDYIESASSMLEELEAAVLEFEQGINREENANAFKRILHKIKGESGIVGINEIAELCHQSETALERLPEHQWSDMLLRFKDWIEAAINETGG